MKLSTRSRYGTRAMFDVALYCNSGSCQLKDIAERQGLSLKYLGHIISTLEKAGLLKNERGKNGGYFLTRPAGSITVKDIVLAVEGSLALVDCVDKPELCDRVHNCPTWDVWKELKEAMENVLASKNLQGLVDSYNKKLHSIGDFTI